MRTPNARTAESLTIEGLAHDLLEFCKDDHIKKADLPAIDVLYKAMRESRGSIEDYYHTRLRQRESGQQSNYQRGPA